MPFCSATCFLCLKEDGFTPVDESVASQVKYLFPEITLIKLAIPLQICPMCKDTLQLFNTFKQICVNNSFTLETRIKQEQIYPTSDSQTVVAVSSDINITEGDVSPETTPCLTEQVITKQEEEESVYNNANSSICSNDIITSQINETGIEDIEVKLEISEEILKDEEFSKEYISNYNNCESETRTDYSNQQYQTIPNHLTPELYQTKNYCSSCNKLFATKYKYQRHMKTHQGIKDFQCSVCYKQFREKHHLQQHMTTHTGVKDFKCTECGKLFAHNKSLSMHMKIHKERLFKCTMCIKRFTMQCLLNAHLKVHAQKEQAVHYK